MLNLSSKTRTIVTSLYNISDNIPYLNDSDPEVNYPSNFTTNLNYY